MQIKIIFCLCLIITLSFVSLTGCTPKNIIPDDTEQITGWGKPKQTPDTDLDSYEYISDNHQDYSFLPSLQTGKDRTVDGLDVRYFCLWGKYNTEIDSIRIRAIQMSIVVPHSTDNYITLEPGF